jgi:hypothetical protein
MTERIAMTLDNDGMRPADCAYYFCGIAVTAAKFGIRLECLSIDDEYGLDAEAKLESLESWCDSDVGAMPFHIARIEDYVTTILAGSAASFIRAEDRRCRLKQSLGSAGLEQRFLRQVWQCLQPETDRAVAIICGSLGSVDDGDVEATTRRLWHRAVRILRQPTHHQQLKSLARHIAEVKRMTRSEIIRVLNRQ